MLLDTTNKSCCNTRRDNLWHRGLSLNYALCQLQPDRFNLETVGSSSLLKWKFLTCIVSVFLMQKRLQFFTCLSRTGRRKGRRKELPREGSLTSKIEEGRKRARKRSTNALLWDRNYFHYSSVECCEPKLQDRDLPEHLHCTVRQNIHKISFV